MKVLCLSILYLFKDPPKLAWPRSGAGCEGLHRLIGLKSIIAVFARHAVCVRPRVICFSLTDFPVWNQPRNPHELLLGWLNYEFGQSVNCLVSFLREVRWDWPVQQLCLVEGCSENCCFVKERIGIRIGIRQHLIGDLLYVFSQPYWKQAERRLIDIFNKFVWLEIAVWLFIIISPAYFSAFIHVSNEGNENSIISSS